MIEDLIRNVDPASARALGEFFNRLAVMLIGNADRTDDAHSALQARKHKTAQIRRLTHGVTDLMLSGATKENAIERVAVRAGVDSKRLAAWWEVDEKKRFPRETRNLQIMRLARRGWSDAEIAARFNINRVTVNRIVRAQLRLNPVGDRHG